MNEEENTLMPWIQQHFSEDEIVSMDLKIFAMFPHKSRVEKLPVLFKAVNPFDRLTFYCTIVESVHNSGEREVCKPSSKLIKLSGNIFGH